MNGIAKATIIKVFNISCYLFVNLRIIKIMKNYLFKYGKWCLFYYSEEICKVLIRWQITDDNQKLYFRLSWYSKVEF